ncbi:hypothetical protein A2U01_0061450, partial [Trifolium medium]|nr:hypothetical protein [Trifolium medium]
WCWRVARHCCGRLDFALSSAHRAGEDGASRQSVGRMHQGLSAICASRRFIQRASSYVLRARCADRVARRASAKSI